MLTTLHTMDAYTQDPGDLNRPTFCLKELPPDELPREKLMSLGPEYLSDAELIAILFRSGDRRRNAVDMARSVLHQIGGLQGAARRGWLDFKQVQGVGTVRAVTLEAALELGRRTQRPEIGVKQKLTSPELVYQTFAPRLRHLHHEEFYVVLLNAGMEATLTRRISSGGPTATIVDPAEVVRLAVLERARYILLIHNHPSGSLKASRQDILLTGRIVAAAETLNILVSDHIIIARDSFVSFRRAGLLPEEDKAVLTSA